VLWVTLGLALVVGLSGVALGTYVLWNNQVVAQAGPSLGVPPSGAAGDSTGSSPSTQTSASADPSQTTSAPAPSVPGAPQTSAGTKVTTKAATSVGTTATTAAAASNAGSYEQQVFTLTNAQRAANGCPALAWNTTLAAVARAHSQDMATKSYFDHNTLLGITPAQRLTAAGYTWTQMAENIAAGQATPADVVATWMGSTGHRANILNCSLKDLGVGFATGGPYGTYWTQDFGAR
jgi:uncharacterized protein YkwD